MSLDISLVFQDFKVGDFVEVTGQCCTYYPTKLVTAEGEITELCRGRAFEIRVENLPLYAYRLRAFKTIDSIKKTTRRLWTMNDIIIEMFPVTKEAVIVDKWFGRDIDKPIFKMLIKGKEQELHQEALRLEEESKKKS